jgi:hypothetical protein
VAADGVVPGVASRGEAVAANPAAAGGERRVCLEPFADDKEMLGRAFEVGKKTCEDIKREVFQKEFADTHIDLEWEAVFFP